MDIGKFLITAGAFILFVGLSIQFAPWLINWFGKLPGDIHIKHEHSTVFIPITSMIVISLLLTLLVNFFFRK
ncbi:DUF2905 domain-containing protein [Methylomarinum sp. Ch1-1]|uniref:DUF2905 domain-containing protein n=1 Tax=Methylomarinum roseum TaxID=3067653 RepID=A0AAU7NW14_9GAMM